MLGKKSKYEVGEPLINDGQIVIHSGTDTIYQSLNGQPVETYLQPGIIDLHIDEDKILLGVVFINDIREIMFDREKYDKVKVNELMFMPSPQVSIDESMEDVANKFKKSEHYNLPVIDNGKYVGFVSRANVFSAYRNLLKKFSED